MLHTEAHLVLPYFLPAESKGISLSLLPTDLSSYLELLTVMVSSSSARE